MSETHDDLEEQIAQRWARFESGFRKSCYGDTGALAELLDILPTGSRRQQCEWELNLQRGRRRDLDFPQRFTALCATACTPEAISYFRGRVEESKRPCLKALYADLLWTTKSGNKNDSFTLAHTAASDYLLSSQEHLKVGDAAVAVDALARSLEIAIRTGQNSWVDAAAQAIVAAMDQFDESHEHVMAKTNLLRFIVANASSQKEHLAPRWIARSILQEIRKARRRSGPDRLWQLRDLWSVLSLLSKREKNQEMVLACQVRIARLWIEQSRETCGEQIEHIMNRVSFLEHAEEIYSSLSGGQYKAEITDLKNEVRNERAKTQTLTARKTSVVTMVQILRDYTDSVIAEYASINVQDALKSIAADSRFLPSRQKAIQNAIEFTENCILGHMPIQVIYDGLKVSESDSDEKRVDHWSRSLFLDELMMRAELLRPVLALLRANEEFSAAVAETIRRSALFSDECLAFVENGLRLYVAEGYADCILSWVFQVESLLRAYWASLGAETFGKRDGVERERPLSEILVALEKETDFDHDLLFLVRCVLSDVAGINLRNKIAHGLMPFDKLNEDMANILFLIFLRIGRWSKQEVRQNA